MIHILLSKKSGRKYMIVGKKDFDSWPEKTKNKFLVVDQGTYKNLEKKQSMLNQFLGPNGKTS